MQFWYGILTLAISSPEWTPKSAGFISLLPPISGSPRGKEPEPKQGM